MSKTLVPVSRSPGWIRLPQFIFRPTEMLDRYARSYGDVYNFGNPHRAFLHVSNPEAIQQIFSASPSIFATDQKSQFFDILFGFNAIFTIDGAAHREQRKLLMPAFHGDRIRTYSQFICNITERLTDSWQPGTTVRVRPDMQDITLQTILRISFGNGSSDRLQRLQTVTSQMLEAISSPASSAVLIFPALQKDWGKWSPWGRFQRLLAEMDRLIYAEIRDRQATPARGDDLISMLLSSYDATGTPPDAQQIRDELVAMLVAGHETTTSALCWALYWIHFHPEVEEKLRAELSARDDRLNVTNLPYLDAVCSETLRIYPIAPTAFLRRLKVPWTLLDYDLQPGTVLLPSIYQLHHREDLYPNPKQFRPERFLERQFSPYEFIPFGGGNRRCLGMALALHEMKLAIATLLDRFTLSLGNHRPEKPVRRGVTLAPRGSLSLTVRSRS